ncbi:hypothetical protein HanOQP8_Chr13g0476621 [Helianthus annuus]|nr:hypothetical protein HanOQP8_Chr13g0476621 [Helianthus annuus]
MGRDTEEFKECYVPKIVSIGPYNFGEPKFQLYEKRKPVFAMDLLSGNKETLRRLYNRLFEMVQELRSFYEKDSTTEFCDKVFTKMMLLDGCFILFCINLVDKCWGILDCRMIREACNHSQIKLFRWFT